jgi:hypothetical protein
MKVIFLDIDGVMNEEKSRSRCVGYEGMDDSKAENLAKIVKATGAKIVLTSTWKEEWQKKDKKRQGILGDYLDKKLKKQGVAVWDKTPSVDEEDGCHYSRGEGILAYIRENRVTAFVILDDYQFDYDGCGLTDYFVKTDAYDGGLTEQLAQRAIQIINA